MYFVDDWNNKLITPTTYRLFGKKYPARMASEAYIEQVQNKLSEEDIRVSESIDLQQPQLSHQDCQGANDQPSLSLDHKCKEPRKLFLLELYMNSPIITKMTILLSPNLE